MPVPKALSILGYFAVAAYLIVGIVGGLSPSGWGGIDRSARVFWIVFLVGGALVLLAGLRLMPRSRWGGAALISVGGFFGALPIFWTGVGLVLGVVLVLLSVRYARGPSRAARRAEPVD